MAGSEPGRRVTKLLSQSSAANSTKTQKNTPRAIIIKQTRWSPQQQTPGFESRRTHAPVPVNAPE